MNEEISAYSFIIIEICVDISDKAFCFVVLFPLFYRIVSSVCYIVLFANNWEKVHGMMCYKIVGSH